MELDTIMQIVFGISATLIAVVGIWFTWHTRGTPSFFRIGLYPKITTGILC
jgi:hypothetical protein